MNTGKGLLLAAMTALIVVPTATMATDTSAVTATTHIEKSIIQAASTASDGVLYEQRGSGTAYGALVNHGQTALSTVSNASIGTDDFVVIDDAGWTVTGFSFNAYGPNGAAPPSRLSLEVHADDGSGAPGELVCSAPALSANYTAMPDHEVRVSLPAPCVLAQGTYWVAWSFDGVGSAADATGWWGQTTVLHNQPAVWRNAGGGFSSGCDAYWGSFAQCGIFAAGVRDFGFGVLGHVNGGLPDLTLGLTVAAYNGDPDECGTATAVEVNVGDQVNICYTLTNNSSEMRAFQTIVDSVDGAVLKFEPMPIGPGETHRYVRTVVATTDTDRTATWTGYVNLPSYAFDDTVVPDFVDISATGNDIGFVPGDGNGNEYAEFATDFPIRFYGQTSTALCIANDGIVVFNDPDCVTPHPGENPPPGYSFNESIPTRHGVNVPTFFAPMWMNIDDGPGHVYTQTLGTAPTRTFIVQWDDLAGYGNGTSTATFQLVLKEDSDTIRFEYLATEFGYPADNGAWATVGLQGDPDGLYTQYSYYQPSLRPDSAIQWDYTAPVSAIADSGAVHVSAGDPTLTVAQSMLTAVVEPGSTTTATLSIANTGNRDLHWSVGEAPGGSAAHFPTTPRYVSRSPLSTVSTWAPGSTLASSGQHWPVRGRPSNVAARINGSFAVPAFGISALRPGLAKFDALDPLSTYTPVDENSDWIYSAAFVGNDFSKLYVISNDSWIYAAGTYGTINTSTGAYTPLGLLTGAATSWWSGMVQDPLTGTVYAVNFDDYNLANAAATLYTLDLATGAATRVGAIDGPGIHPLHYISGIAISPAGLMYGLDLYGQSLIAIDKSSGAASVIDYLGLDVQFIQDIAFDPQTGDLYWAAFRIDDNNEPVGEMRVIDPLTANSQAIGSFPAAGTSPVDEISALAIATPAVGCAAPADVPWLSLSPGSGTITTGGTAQDVTVSFDASELAAGLHQATICVFSDDPRHRSVAVSVALAVSEPVALYDQTIFDTDVRAFNNTIVAPPGTAGMSAEGADDFVVTDNGWTLSGFHFTAYGNNGNPMPTHMNLRVLADAGNGQPSDDVVCAADNLPVIAVDAPNQIGAWLPGGCHLAAGTYWVAWSFADVNIASPILGFWGATTELHNQPAVWHNPGGMLGAGCTSWSTFDQCPSQFDPSAKDFGFAVFGEATAIDCGDVLFADGFDGNGGNCGSTRAPARH